MRITKLGQLPGTKIYKAKCTHCSTKFEFERNEAEPVQDRDGDLLVLACPLCNLKVFTPE